MEKRDGTVSMRPVRRHFFTIVVAGVVLNVIATLILSSLTPLQPLPTCLISSAVVILFVVPFFYLKLLRPIFEESQNSSQRTEDALRRSDIHYRIVSELTTTFVFDLVVAEDGKATFDFVSDEFYPFTGYDDLKPDTFEDVVAHILPDDKESFLENFRRLIAGPMSAEIECRIYVNGPYELKWLKMYARSEWDDQQGRITTIHGGVRDITEAKAAEEALIESQRQIEFILGSSNTGLSIIDDQLNLLYVDPYWSKLHGPWQGKKCHEYLEDSSQRCPDCSVQRALATKRISIEERISVREKNRVVQITATPYQDKNGKWLVAEVDVDITERKKAEDALKESEEKFRSIIEQSAEGMIITDANGIIEEWNKAQETISGLSRSKVVGLPIWEVQSRLVPQDGGTPEFFTSIQTSCESFLRGERNRVSEKEELRIFLSDGNIKWVTANAFLVRRGGKNMIVSTVNDITDKKNAKEEKLRLEQYLQRAKKLESLGVLAGGIAHDFNNILLGVFGFVDLARSQAKDQVVSDYLSRAMESMDRAKALTQQLLTFAKGGAPVKRVTSISPIIEETCRFSLHGSNIRCDLNIPEGLWHCNADRNQIAQVIQNLVINARQAMPMGGSIEVTAKNTVLRENECATLKKGNYVLVSITDQGTGMSQEMLSRIFDPFFTTKTEGHGLGLAICHSIVSRHGGAITVQSELGKGTTFSIYLPASDEDCVEKSKIDKIKHTGTGRVLVMDDDESVRKAISIMLQLSGYSVESRGNGKDTIDLFVEEAKGSNPFTAVILDLTIPGGMGGKEVAEEIRKLDNDIPLFVASGYANDPVIAHPKEYGLTASISKPFEMADLIEVLEGHIGKQIIA